MRISYVLPIKWDGDEPLSDLTAYLQYLAPHTELIVVDGSNPENFQKHQRAWSKYAKHIAPYPEFRFSNGKVNGVLTGLAEATHEHLVFADDDVRYTLAQLDEMDSLLRDFQLVSPQNYFAPCPWHARWDSSRSLLNRAFAHDYPGTLAVQRSFLQQLGGYDGNVLFENLELIRTIKAGNGLALEKSDLFVRRLPPSSKHFWSQRVRQAFDDYAQPARWGFFILLLPVSIMLAILSPWFIVAEIVLAILIAEAGRQKNGASKVFNIKCSFYAPVWLLERGVCTWLALFQKLFRGGVIYNRSVISQAANPISKIRSRLQAKKLGY